MPQCQSNEVHSEPQLSLALAPPRIQDCLRDAHNHPLAGFKDGGKMVSHRVPPSELWGYPFTEIGQTYTSYCALVFDCDDPDAAELAFYDKTFPRPSWMVQNQENRHLHVGYGLVLPVHRYEAAKPKPLQTLRRVAEYGTRALNADPGFSGVLTRNPEPRNPIPNYGERTRTWWGRKRLFWLSEFNLYIPKGWRAPRPGQGHNRNWPQRGSVPRLPGLGRAPGKREQGRARLRPGTRHRGPRTLRQNIRSLFSRFRGSGDCLRRTAQWAGKWHSPQFIGRQKARGKRGGAASGKVRRKRTEIRDAMILAWWRAGYTQREIGAFIKLSQVRVCKIVNRDKDLPVPARMVGLRIWDPGVGESGGVIEPHRKARPRHEPENPPQFDPEPVQTSLHLNSHAIKPPLPSSAMSL